MAKKAKKVQKVEPEESEERNQMVEEKPSRASKKSSFDLANIFSESFRQRLSDYIALNSEVMTLRGSIEKSDQSEEIARRKADMAEKVEGAAGSILKGELVDLEDWIKEEQTKLSEQIIKISQAHEETRKVLVKTGFFEEAEIDKNLSFVKAKQSDFQNTYANYQSLLERSQSIYN